MPKRVLRHHLENAAKVRRKSMFVPDDGKDNEEELIEKPAKEMKYLKFNKNNEIERLLLHNSKILVYHVNHCNFPAFNVGMWPQENNEMLTNYPSCAFSVPQPIYVANKPCDKIDICYKRPMNNDLFMKGLKLTRTTYQTALKSNKAIRSSRKEGIYHYSVYDMAERIYLRTDPFFFGSYDHYFSGGNLSVLPNGANILHASGEQLLEMTVSELPVEDYNITNSLQKIASRKTSEKCEIFEMRPFISSLDNSRQNGFIARQRNLVTFNYLNNEKQKIETLKQFRTKVTPFISFAQSERDPSKFIITTMNQDIRLYDLNCKEPALVKRFQISPEPKKISWNTVKPWRENTFLYANEKQFFLIDTRTSPEQWLGDITSATDSMMCDHISAVLPSDFKNLFYVATNHKLHCMDIRHLKKFSFSDIDGAICRWTHQLLYAPLMMDTFRLPHSEYIALASPVAGDLHICQLSRERNDQEITLDSSMHAPKHIYRSPCLPYQPPTLLEAYEHARISGKCLRPEANLEARLKCCTTGMKFMKSSLNNSESSIGLLLTSNSNGDIFAHTLSKREKKENEERCNRQSDEIMTEFEQKIYEQTQLPLSYTEIKNMKGLRKVFLCKSLSSVQKYDFDDMDSEYDDEVIPANNVTNPPANARPKRLHLGRWQKSLSTLHSYKDALAADLLSIWDIDIEEEKHIHLGNLRNKAKTDPAAKVEDWLKTNINPPMLSIPTQEISQYSDYDTSHIFDSTTNITQTQNTTIDFENAVHSTQIIDNTSKNLNTSTLEIQLNNETTTTVLPKLKTKKKNKKYIKGF